MAIREFTDTSGTLWRVWSTVPTSPDAVAPELRDGWLAFDSGVERRRVGPIPGGWEELPVERLQLLCRVATPAHTSDPFGIATHFLADVDTE